MALSSREDEGGRGGRGTCTEAGGREGERRLEPHFTHVQPCAPALRPPAAKSAEYPGLQWYTVGRAALPAGGTSTDCQAAARRCWPRSA